MLRLGIKGVSSETRFRQFYLNTCAIMKLILEMLFINEILTQNFLLSFICVEC